MIKQIAFIAIISLACFSTLANAQCKGLEDGYHAYGEQCDAYLHCVNGIVVEEALCEDGLVFNKYGDPKLKRCQLPHNIDCSDRPYLQQAQPSGECPNQFALVGKCSSFLNCAHGIPYSYNCPEGLVFNETAGVCDWGDRVPDCQVEQILGFACPTPIDQEQMVRFNGHARYPHADPSHYYVCMPTTSDGRPNISPRYMSCPADTLFDGETLQCEPQSALLTSTTSGRHAPTITNNNRNVNSYEPNRNSRPNTPNRSPAYQPPSTTSNNYSSRYGNPTSSRYSGASGRVPYSYSNEAARSSSSRTSSNNPRNSNTSSRNPYENSRSSYTSSRTSNSQPNTLSRTSYNNQPNTSSRTAYNNQPNTYSRTYNTQPNTASRTSYNSQPNTASRTSYNSQPNTASRTSYNSQPNTSSRTSYNNQPNTYSRTYNTQPNTASRTSYNSQPNTSLRTYNSQPNTSSRTFPLTNSNRNSYGANGATEAPVRYSFYSPDRLNRYTNRAPASFTSSRLASSTPATPTRTFNVIRS